MKITLKQLRNIIRESVVSLNEDPINEVLSISQRLSRVETGGNYTLGRVRSILHAKLRIGRRYEKRGFGPDGIATKDDLEIMEKLYQASKILGDAYELIQKRENENWAGLKSDEEALASVEEWEK